MTSGEGATQRSPRERVIDAAMKLAANREFADVTITDIAHEAGISLADFRDLFPSKGAVLGGFLRRIDRQVLDGADGALSTESARERLFEVLKRRLAALEPHREALASVARWADADPLMATALNREAVNSLRFMLEAADIDSDGPVGALKLQGLAFAWKRVLDAWFRHGEMEDALDALDRALDRGEKWTARAEDLARVTRPFYDFARGLIGKRATSRAREGDEDYPHPGA